MDAFKFLKSVIDQDSAPVVICNTEHVVVYMNPAAKDIYKTDLTGKSLKLCHSEEANKKIDQVISWFFKSSDNNVVYTYYNDKENKDVYMVALRDEDEKLIGYYEKHEYRNRETQPLYRMEL